MKTKIEFLDPKRVAVETPQGDHFILGFNSEINYLLENQSNVPFTEFLGSLFDKYYQGDDSIVFGSIFRELVTHNFSSPLYFQRDKFKERIHLGERIKELRQQKGIDAKTLAYQAGIDASNLCRIEQGRYAPGFDVLNKIANAMGMKIDFVDIN